MTATKAQPQTLPVQNDLAPFSCTFIPNLPAAYASPIFVGLGSVIASPADGNLFYVNQSATIQSNTSIQSRYIVSENTCQVYSETGNFYPLTANVVGTTGINLNANTDYKVTFE